MEQFHKDVYDFILDLFASEVKKKKAKKLLVEAKGFFEEQASKKVPCYHQCYEGGLADHTALVCLEAFHTVITKPWCGVDPDDILIVGLFHDLDKVGLYMKEFKRVANNDRGTVLHVEKYGLRNVNTQDGIVLAHGGWAGIYEKSLRGITHPPIAVYAHAADMFASHVTKTRVETRNRIREIMAAILEIVVPKKEIDEFEKNLKEATLEVR